MATVQQRGQGGLGSGPDISEGDEFICHAGSLAMTKENAGLGQRKSPVGSRLQKVGFSLHLLREHASRALGVQGEQAHESVRPLHANFVMPFPHLQ